MHELGVTLSVNNGADTSFKYPLIPSGTIKVQNSGYLPRLNYQEKSIDLYRLRSGPYISTSNRLLRLPYKSNVKTEYFYINTNNYYYEAYLKVGSSDQEYLCTINKDTVSTFDGYDFVDPKSADRAYRVEYSQLESRWAVWATGENYEQEDGETYIAATLIFKTYVKSSDFIEDLNGNSILGKFSQDYIDNTLIENNVQTARVEISRLSKKESSSEIRPHDENALSRFGTGFDESFYAYDPNEANTIKGEPTERTFDVNLSDYSLTVDINELQNNYKYSIKSAEYTYQDGGLLTIGFFDRIHRFCTNTELLNRIFIPQGSIDYSRYVIPSSKGGGICGFFEISGGVEQYQAPTRNFLFLIQSNDKYQLNIPIVLYIGEKRTETTILQFGWKRGIAIDTNIYLGLGNLETTVINGTTEYTKKDYTFNIEIDSTYSPTSYNESNDYQYSSLHYMCQVALPEFPDSRGKISLIKDSDPSSNIFSSIELNNGGIGGIEGLHLVRVNSNDLYSQNLTKIDGDDTILDPNINNRSSAIIGGYKWYLYADKNNTRNTRKGSMIVKDKYGNKVTINISQPGTRQDEMYAFKDYDEEANEAKWKDLITMNNRVIFSSNGEMLYQDYIYILTTDSDNERAYYWKGIETLENYTNTREILIYGDNSHYWTYPTSIGGGNTWSSQVGCIMDTRAEWYDVDSSSNDFPNNGKITGIGNNSEYSYLSSKRWRVYKVRLTSKIKSYTLSSDTDIPRNYMSGNPYKRDFGIERRAGNNESISTTIYAAYGISYLSFVDTPYHVDTADSSFTVNFGQPTSNITAYTESGSITSTNNKQEGGSNFPSYIMDDTIYLICDDNRNGADDKISSSWDNKGYYSAWKLDCIRKEWNEQGNRIIDLGANSSAYDKYIGYSYDNGNDQSKMSLGIVHDVSSSSWQYDVRSSNAFHYPFEITNGKEGLLIKTNKNLYSSLQNSTTAYHLRDELVIKTTAKQEGFGDVNYINTDALEYKFYIDITLINIDS